ncbi:tetratricopeptide repeat protein 27-like [Diadema antillarum]|uniref:tetratricopeptide repeat protein 27-like n=1 Tax=Diadema antillarum TaxID=105358 RepID=UPI003A8A8F7C
MWNALPPTVVAAPSLELFRSRRLTPLTLYVKEALNAMAEGDFGKVLHLSIARLILGWKSADASVSLADLIKEGISSFVSQAGNPEDAILRQLLTLCVGIASLQLFVQNNWTGPISNHKASEFLPQCFQSTEKEKEVHDFAKSSLSPTDTTIYSLVCIPQLLLTAKCILVDSSCHLQLCKTADWWRLRCLWIQQQLLDERSPEIYAAIMPLIESFKENEILMSSEETSALPIMLHLECCHIFAYYYEYKLATNSITSAQKLSGLEVALSGALGKRTRFQEEDRAQLVLRVRREGDGGGEQKSEKILENVPEGLPKSLSLDDDTVLDAINFQDEGSVRLPGLSGLEQAVILGVCMEHKRSRAKDLLLAEEVISYLVGILQQPQDWSVQTLALRVRCQMEKSKSRKRERAMMQMQVLVDQISSATCSAPDRLKLFYCVNLPPRWTLEGELAELLISLGCVSAALEIYVRLQLWEDVVSCYRSLGKPDKAIHVIEEQLAVKESALMWCLLGDVTQEKKYYEKAWEVSGQRSNRAQRSLGIRYLHDKEYEKAIECLELSLERNFLQYGAWFSLGYAAFQCERYDTAAKAYRRCVLLEADNSQSWNNLATAYVKLNEKGKAFRTLQEALKRDYENWKIWDNFLGVSMDVGEFEEGIRAYSRLLDLREKHVDEAVLGVMVRVVMEDVMDNTGRPGSVLKPKLVELFGRLTSQVTNNSVVWSLYGRLLGGCLTDNAIENDKALQCLVRSHRLVTQDQRWHSEVSSVQEVIQASQTLTEAYLHCSKEKQATAQAIQLLSSAKLMLKSVISKIKQEYYDPVSPPESWKDLSNPVSGLETKLQEVMDRIAQLKAA